MDTADGYPQSMDMPDRSRSTRPRDLNQLAASIVEEAVDGDPRTGETGKDPAAVALGRKGGLVGGRRRAATLSPERRAEIAKAAAKARWAGKADKQ